MTEDEAKTKDCPCFRYCVNEIGVVQDRNGPIYAHERCRGSECIAWRWTKKPKAAHPLGKPSTPGQGFCGLAGRP